MDEQIQTEGVQAPLHRRIAESLSNQVSGGALKPGEKLPSERQIARQFQASRATVRTALQNMEQAGLVTRRERRSAVVSIRRSVTPHLRVACTSSGLMRLLRRLTEMQIIPPRCQLQLIDPGQSGQIGQILEHPATGADLLICEMEYLSCLRSEGQRWSELPGVLARDAEIPKELQELCSDAGKLMALPIGVSPMLMYYNRRSFEEAQVAAPSMEPRWSAVLDATDKLRGEGKFALQFRPKFEQLAAIMAGMGNSLYGADGKVCAQEAAFEQTLRFIHLLLHAKKVTPLLAKVDQINPFAEGRCAMAVDGFDAYGTYREKLGDQLGLTSAPQRESGNRMGVLSGFVALATATQEDNSQAVHDLLRRLVAANTQMALTQMGAALPVRGSLLNTSALNDLQVPSHLATVLLEELQVCKSMNLPGTLDHKRAVEELFLELWLGLDEIGNICNRFKQL